MRPPDGRWLPWACGLGAVCAGLLLVAVAGFLVAGAASGELDWLELLGSATWDPPRGAFGAAAMVFGTVAVSGMALVAAAPLGWAIAVAVHELVPRRWSVALRTAAELLAVVPSTVYGLVGIAYLRPAVADLTGLPGGDGLLTAAVILAVMVLPTIVAVSVDALAHVPGGEREAGAALGLTRLEVIRSVVLPSARGGLVAAALLGLARALGETVAVFLLVGRADGRLPGLDHVLPALAEPGQTLTTKLNGPEPLLAGTSGAHWAALCGLGLLLLASVAALTFAGSRGAGRRGRRLLLVRRGGARRARALRDRAGRAALLGVLALPPALFAGVVAATLVKGAGRGLEPSFWLESAAGAAGGGIRDQVLGTLLLVAATGALAAPVGLALGLATAEYARPWLRRTLHVATVTLAGVPSILLGLMGYALFATTLGWGKSWLTGAIVLSAVAIPVVAVAVATAVEALPAERREAARAVGLRRDQVVRSVVLPHVRPALLTGLLLGLARAAGETAPLLFTATVFVGADALPGGVVDQPIVALPTHLFNLIQDAADPAALQAAWGSALALLLVASGLLIAAAPLRRRGLLA